MGNLKLVKNKKGLSPIFAVLILIAITVIAGIVVYMYSSGYLATMFGGGTTGQEKVAIQAIECSTGTATVYAKSVGGGTVTITDCIIKDASGNTKSVIKLGASVELPSNGDMKDFTITDAALTSGETFTITLVSKSGNQFVSPSFKVP